jgi:hypothetical protein
MKGTRGKPSMGTPRLERVVTDRKNYREKEVDTGIMAGFVRTLRVA